MLKSNKKKFAMISGVVASLCIVGSAFAVEGIKLVIDGQQVVPTEAPQNVNGHIMVPIGFVSDALGAKVQWDGNTQTVSIDSQGKKSLQMEVDQFVNGLAPTTSDQAVELYMNGLQHRNAALQYAALSDELKKIALPQFEQGNWVTGASSPWFENWSVVKQNKINDQTVEYQVKTLMATSTGLGQPAIIKITVTKTQDHWFVSSLGDDQLDSSPSNTIIAGKMEAALARLSYLDDKSVFQFSVKNQTEQIQHFSFNTTQRYRYEITDEHGNQVKLWPMGMLFGNVVSTTDVKQGEALSYSIEVEGLPQGKYHMKVWLTADKEYSAETDFEVNKKGQPE